MRLRVLLAILLVCGLTAAAYWNSLAQSGMAAYFLGILPKNRAVTVESGPKVGSPAPDFQLEDLDGSIVRLADFRGTPVVLALGSYT